MPNHSGRSRRPARHGTRAKRRGSLLIALLAGLLALSGFATAAYGSTSKTVKHVPILVANTTAGTTDNPGNLDSASASAVCTSLVPGSKPPAYTQFNLQVKVSGGTPNSTAFVFKIFDQATGNPIVTVPLQYDANGNASFSGTVTTNSGTSLTPDLDYIDGIADGGPDATPTSALVTSDITPTADCSSGGGSSSGSTSVPPPPPTSSTSTTPSSGSLSYTGQGIPVKQECDANNTPYLLFIFTYGGNYSPTNVVLHGVTVVDKTTHGNEVHFTTAYVDPSTLVGKAYVTWNGTVGKSAQLVISHGCSGAGSSSTTPGGGSSSSTTPGGGGSSTSGGSSSGSTTPGGGSSSSSSHGSSGAHSTDITTAPVTHGNTSVTSGGICCAIAVTQTPSASQLGPIPHTGLTFRVVGYRLVTHYTHQDLVLYGIVGGLGGLLLLAVTIGIRRREVREQ